MNQSEIRAAALASVLIALSGCDKGRVGDPPLPKAARVETAKPTDRGTATDPMVVAYRRGVIVARLRFQEMEVDYRRRLSDRVEDDEAEYFQSLNLDRAVPGSAAWTAGCFQRAHLLARKRLEEAEAALYRLRDEIVESRREEDVPTRRSGD